MAFSDGVTEALSASGEEYGEDRLHRVRRSRERASHFRTCSTPSSPASASSATGAVQSDDVTALVLRYDG